MFCNHLFFKGVVEGEELLRLPHAEYCNSQSVILRLQKKGLISTEIKPNFSPEENLPRSIFGEKCEKYTLTSLGKTLVKDGVRIVRKFKKMGVDITNPHVDVDDDPESEDDA